MMSTYSLGKAAESLMYLEMLGERDVTDCPLCKESMSNVANPKVLPCTHTFCCKCLDAYWNIKNTEEKKPGEKVYCPICRAEFKLPAGGISMFPNNTFIEKLSEAQMVSKVEIEKVPCCICSKSGDPAESTEGEDDKTESAIENHATSYCLGCHQYMCKGCAKIHANLNSSKFHQVLSLETPPKIEHMLKVTTNCCTRHPDKEIDTYCLDCRSAICPSCFEAEHSKHDCVPVTEIADDLRKQITSDIEKIDTLTQDVSQRRLNVETQLTSFHESVEKAEKGIMHKGKKLHRVLDKRVQALLQELAEEKASKLRELEHAKNELQAQQFILESFKRYSREVLHKGASSDIARSAHDLNNRTRKLASLPFVRLKKTIDVSFIPSKLDLKQAPSVEKLNVLGQLSCSKIYLQTHKSISSDRSPSLLSTVPCANWVTGLTIYNEEIYICLGCTSEIKVYDKETLAYQMSISIRGLNDPWDMVSSSEYLFVSEQKNRLIYRVEMVDTSITKWSVDSEFPGLSTTKIGNLMVACHTADKLIEFTPSGEVVREFLLQPDLSGPYHAILLDSGDILMCHASPKLHRVCLLDIDGNLTKSYGTCAGSEEGYLHSPIHLAVDQFGYILVSDHQNNRVVLLTPSLEFSKEFIPNDGGLDHPFRLLYDEEEGKLHLSDYSSEKFSTFGIF